MGGLRHAAYCATRNLYGHMEMAAKSLVANTDVDKVHFIIEDAEFPRPLPDIIECHDVSGQEWFDREGPNVQQHWTWMVLMRAALCHVLPDVDRVLSLDCDTIVHGDATGVWDLPIDGCYYAAVTERHKSQGGLQYGNFGVTLFNLEKLRDGKADECISVINSRKYTWPEQDVCNYLCQGRILEMPRIYNDMAFNGPTEEPLITHYAGQPNDSWTTEREPTRYREMTWDEAMELHGNMRYRDKVVLFSSDNDLERAENLRAVWDAYHLPKRFVKGVRNIAGVKDCPVIVYDTFPPYVPDKAFKAVSLGHGFGGCKTAGLEEKRPGIDPRAFDQMDYIIGTSDESFGVGARSYGAAADRVKVLGMPRTDAYIGKSKGDGGTFMSNYKRAYLYAPTFRGPHDGDKLSNIDWAALDALMEDDELLVVKRHYWTSKPLVTQDVEHIAEVSNVEASAPYLMDCDVLVTDYSSIMVDAYLLGKPVVLTVDDAESYLRTRGMCFEYPQLYSSRHLAAEGHEADLLALLREAADNGMGEVEEACKERLACACDGHATERVVEFVKSLL